MERPKRFLQPIFLRLYSLYCLYSLYPSLYMLRGSCCSRLLDQIDLMAAPHISSRSHLLSQEVPMLSDMIPQPALLPGWAGVTPFALFAAPSAPDVRLWSRSYLDSPGAKNRTVLRSRAGGEPLSSPVRAISVTSLSGSATGLCPCQFRSPKLAQGHTACILRPLSPFEPPFGRCRQDRGRDYDGGTEAQRQRRDLAEEAPTCKG